MYVVRRASKVCASTVCENEEVSVGGTRPASVVAAPVMVTYLRDDLILFEDGKYTLAELRSHLEGYANKTPGAVLLVRANKEVSAQALANLGSIAEAAGFASMLLAAEPTPTESMQK